MTERAMTEKAGMTEGAGTAEKAGITEGAGTTEGADMTKRVGHGGAGQHDGEVVRLFVELSSR